jgi:hypothetical protein
MIYTQVGRLLVALVATTTMVSCSMLESEALRSGNPIPAGSEVYSLPKTLVTLKVPKVQGSDRAQVGIDGMTLTTRTIADPNHTYILRLTPAPLYEDTLVVEVDSATRFIKSVDATSSDKTAGILSELGKAAARVSGIPGGPKLFSADTVDYWSFEFDPSDPTWVAETRKLIQVRAGIDFNCLVGCELPAAVPTVVVDAILVRPPRTMLLAVCETSCEQVVATRVFPVFSFNGSPLVSVPVARSPFVERKTKLTFVDGIPTKIDHNKPSEALGLASIPGAVIGSIVSGLGQAATDQKAQIESATALVGAQKAHVEAQQNLVKAQEEFRKTQEEVEKTKTKQPSGDPLPPGAGN